MAIRNIIFDLGGVVLNIDPMRTVKAFEDLGVHDMAALYNFPKQVPLFDALEVGATDEAGFRSGLRQLFGLNLTDEQIDEAWNKMLLDFPPQRMKILEQVGKNYRTFLLSNTNSIHIRAFFSYLKTQFGYEDLSHLFERAYYSHLAGMRKPDPQLFARVLRENGLQAHETLFIDDALPNLDGAREVGIHAYHLHIFDKDVTELFSDGFLIPELA